MLQVAVRRGTCWVGDNVLLRLLAILAGLIVFLCSLSLIQLCELYSVKQRVSNLHDPLQSQPIHSPDTNSMTSAVLCLAQHQLVPHSET